MRQIPNQLPVSEQSMADYRALMDEIKYRLDFVHEMATGQLRVRTKLAEESCYLQLRLVCELIAIGCLLIHGDIPKLNRGLFKTYKVDWVFKVLGAHHPKFFPQALGQDSAGPDGIIQMNPKKSGALTKDELLRLWHRESGGRLHRRAGAWDYAKTDMSAVAAWHGKIVQLLNTHLIVSPDESWGLRVAMQTADGSVVTNLLEIDQRLTNKYLPQKG